MRFDKTSQLYVKRKHKTYIDKEGRKITLLREEPVRTDTISLGSIAKPKNTDIVVFHWKDIEEPNLSTIFGTFGSIFK